jgi:uncharacterized protein YdeI (YjbR/CyaY-like superfamily)
MPPKPDLPIVQLETQADWAAWLERHHGDAAGVWLKIAKKNAPTTTVTYSDALDEALCVGWIDGQKRPHDDQFWLQRFTPRKPRSRWSQRNRVRAEELIQSGRMRPRGLAEVAAAQRDGRWGAAYEPQGTASVPEDLRRALDENPEAKAFFETLTGANRYAILYRISDARRAETRARRIADYVQMCAEHRTLH